MSRIALANALVATKAKITATLSYVEAIFQVQMLRYALRSHVAEVKVGVARAQTGQLTIGGTVQILAWQARHVRELALLCQTRLQICFVFLFEYSNCRF